MKVEMFNESWTWAYMQLMSKRVSDDLFRIMVGSGGGGGSDFVLLYIYISLVSTHRGMHAFLHGIA